MRGRIADSPVVDRGCSRAWPWDSAPSRLRSTCLSGRTAAPRNRRERDRPTSVLTRQIAPVYAPIPDPNSDTADLFPLPRNPFPATHPWRYPRTTADAREIRCPGPTADSPPVAAAPSPNSPLRGLRASAVAKTHPAPVDATLRMPASSCRTRAAAAVPARSVYLHTVQLTRRQFPVVREQAHGGVSFFV